MPMVRLIYASRFSRGVGPNDIPDILAVSREKNAAAGVTGILCYDPRYFLQVLEGSRRVVNELYNQIAGDERHGEVTLIEYGDINERLFENWAMAYVRVNSHPPTAEEPAGDIRGTGEDEREGRPEDVCAEPASTPDRPASPRQLVGQPAGPGIATGPARIVADKVAQR